MIVWVGLVVCYENHHSGQPFGMASFQVISFFFGGEIKNIWAILL